MWRDGARETLTATIGAQGQDTLAVAETANGDGAKLGVMLAPRGEPGKAGVTIAEVAPGSPAARNGLRPGDVIVQAGSRMVSSPDDVAGAVHAAASGDKPVLLLVERGDHRRYVAIELDRGLNAPLSATTRRAERTLRPPVSRLRQSNPASPEPQPDHQPGGVVLQLQRRFVKLGDGGDETQAESASRRAARGLESIEPPQHRFALLGRNARPAVGDHDGDGVVVGGDVQRHGAPFGGVLHCVVEQVRERLEDQIGIAVDRRLDAGVAKRDAAGLRDGCIEIGNVVPYGGEGSRARRRAGAAGSRSGRCEAAR